MSDDLLRDYADVYLPDTGPHARGLEFHEGWLPIVRDYCERLRALKSGNDPVKLRWAKEKFASLRLFTTDDRRQSSILQQYHLDYTHERARRASLRYCERCGRPGRARWGTFLATLCDDHVDVVGDLRPEDGIILDPDRERIEADGTVRREIRDQDWTDEELGLDDCTWDGGRLFRLQYRPLLMADIELPDDLALMKLRKKLDAVDQAIGRHHEVKFKLRSKGYEIAIDTSYPSSTVDEIKRDAIIAEIELIMSGEQQ